ncbi:MAG: M48 family peptidase, partial [Verrucomicrobia bacterium]|nr:M48 family peptidase [Verrucomicrobiota bacterium]
MLSKSQLAARVVLGLILAKATAQFWLVRRNARGARAHAGEVPEAFRDMIDAVTYARSIEYTLAKLRLRQIADLADALMLVVVLFSGVLPAAWESVSRGWGSTSWAMSAFLLVVNLGLGLLGLPWEWYAQFGVEARFGFNTTTRRLWCLDRLKGLALGVLLGYPLLVLVLQLANWTGRGW